MKIFKSLLMLSLGLMATSCSDENTEIMVEEESASNEMKSVNLTRNSGGLWAPGETIKYYFNPDIPGTAAQKAMLRDCMDEIERYANITFMEVSRLSASSVSFAFDQNRVRVYEGFKKCDGFGFTGKPDFVNDLWKTNEILFRANRVGENSDDFRGRMLHSLMHLLGFCDEANNPNANLCLSKTKMIDWYTKNYGSATKAENHYNVQFGSTYQSRYQKYSEYTSFDPASIMMTEVNSEWTTNGVSYKSNKKLSAGDIQRLKVLYPYPNGMVPLYVGSNTVSWTYEYMNKPYYTRSGVLDGFIGRYEDFKDPSLIRKKVGYGYGNLTWNADKFGLVKLCTQVKRVLLGYYPPMAISNIKMPNYGCAFAPGYTTTSLNTMGDADLVYNRIFRITSGFGNNAQTCYDHYCKGSTSWNKHTVHYHPLSEYGNFPTDVDIYAQVLSREGDDRTPIVQYYNSKTKKYGVSYHNDVFMKNKGYTELPGVFYAVWSSAKPKYAGY